MKSIRSKSAFSILHFSLALVGLGASLAVYYSTSFYLIGDFVYNSDSLYLPAFFSDVIHGNNLSQWNLPPSSYIFPDMLLYFGMRTITPSIQIATVIFGITQYLIFALGLMLLAKQALPRAYSSIGPGLIALMSIGFMLSLANLEFYSQMIFVSAHHFGIVLIMPFVLAITHKLLAESQVSIPLICVLCGLSFLTTLSDWLYLVQLAIPLVASLIILRGLKKIDSRRTFLVASALIAPSLIGLGVSLIYVWNRPQLVAYTLRPQPIDSSFRQLATSLTSIPPFHAILAIIFLGICALIFAIDLLHNLGSYSVVTTIVVSFTTKARLKSQLRLTFARGLMTIARIFRKASTVNIDGALLPLYFFLASAVNFLAVISSGIFADRDGFRYFLPVLIFSGFWGLPFIVPIPKTIKPIFFEWAVVGALGLFVFLGWENIDWQGFTFDYYPPFIQCLDEKTSALGIQYGIANYWQARPISTLSQTNLKVVQVNRDLSPYQWINNSAEYAIEPEFAVIDTSFPENYPFRLDENLITSRFGKPDATFECERNKILVYRSNDKFKLLFNDALQK